MKNKSAILAFIILFGSSFYVPYIWMITAVISAVIFIEIYFRNKTIEVLR